MTGRNQRVETASYHGPVISASDMSDFLSAHFAVFSPIFGKGSNRGFKVQEKTRELAIDSQDVFYRPYT